MALGGKWRAIFAIPIVIFLVLALARVLTTEPWVDEAWYASPSWSIIHHGNTGTPLLETAGQFWRGINERTYWVLPLQFFVQVPWFKAFGFSLFTARLFAMAWGLIALISWGLIVRYFTSDRVMAVVAMLVMAVDYQFVAQMALDRMDAMSLALGTLGILSYLALREKHFAAALFVSQACVTACGLTHPTPGVPAFCGVAFLILYFDRRRLRASLIALAAIPYLLGAAGWYWYISPDPEMFRAQFLGNVVDIDRLGGFRHPLRAIARELARHATMAGFAANLSPLNRIKAAVVLVYAFSVAGLFANRETRQDPRIRPLLGLWLVYLLVMTFYDNTKDPKYAVHLVPLYDALTAVWLVWLWRRGAGLRLVGVAAGVLFAVVSAGGLLYTSLVIDTYRKSFLPAAQFVSDNAKPGDLIIAASQFGFPLGFDRNMVDDARFTFSSHKSAEFIVIGESYREFIDNYRVARPDIYQFIQNLLAQHYHKVYSHAGYDIFQLNR